jgi:Gpi18-like mannosyltransferase
MICRKTLQQVVVNVLPVYRCNVCHKEQPGYSATATIRDVREFDAIGHVIESTFSNIQNNHMPYGWASYAGGVHKCPSCKG